jgi:hypothetical protein
MHQKLPSEVPLLPLLVLLPLELLLLMLLTSPVEAHE